MRGGIAAALCAAWSRLRMEWEHIGRYLGLIGSSAGLTVYGNDHRGHGRTLPAHFGDFGKAGFDLLMEEMVRLSRIAKEENPEDHSSCWGTVWGPSRRDNTRSTSREIDGLMLS